MIGNCKPLGNGRTAFLLWCYDEYRVIVTDIRWETDRVVSFRQFDEALRCFNSLEK